MSHDDRRNHADCNARIWEPIIEAWRHLPDDQEVVMVSDIVPHGFPGIDAPQIHATKPSWVWRKV